MAAEASVPDEVVGLLSRRYGPLVQIGAGAWSVAFRAERDGEPIVVRVGEYVSDFLVDAEMATYDRLGLPIPEVFDVDRLEAPHDNLHICVSAFAPGTPLEAVDSVVWKQLVAAVADLLETMRAITPPPAESVPTWPQTLLDRAAMTGRFGDWQSLLADRPDELAAYRAVSTGLAELCELPQVANVAPTLLHCDLINRNVHVDNGVIAGVFDWGCRRWGDHLYELAWFEFWAPWHPNINVEMLRVELIRRWGEVPDADRLSACRAHIGLDHLVYNASIGESGAAVVDRLHSFGLISRPQSGR